MNKPVNMGLGVLFVALLLFSSLIALGIYSNGQSDTEDSSEFLVIYDFNDGTGTVPEEFDLTEGTTFEVASSIDLVVPEGKRLVEWNTSRDGKGISYASGAEVTMPAENLRLYAIWETIKYTVTWNNSDGTVFRTVELDYGTIITKPFEIPENDSTDEFDYTFKEWIGFEEGMMVSKNETFTADFTATKRSYIITWEVEGFGDVTKSFEYGILPTYPKGTPTKVADNGFTYKFKGWSPNVAKVTGDAAYTAEFYKVTNKYAITWIWKDVDGMEKTETEQLAYNTQPSKDGTDYQTTSTVYTFAGWDSTIKPVTGDATYTATYDESVRKYTITWKVEGSEDITSSVEYDTLPVYSGETPTKESTVSQVFEFTGWNPVLTEVDGEAVYTAQFSESPRTYTISFDEGITITDGTAEIVTGTSVAYDTVLTVTADEKTGHTSVLSATVGTIAEDGKYTVEGAVTFSVEYTVNEYTITFNSNGGTGTAGPITDDYDSPVTLPVDGVTKTEHKFKGWSLEVDGTVLDSPYTLTKDITLYAVWEINQYSITFDTGITVKKGDVSIASGDKVAYDTVLTVTIVDKTGYILEVLAGEEIIIDEGNFTADYTVAGDAEFNLKETAIVYTITWNIDGVTNTTTVEYGTDNVAKPEATTKEGYTFSGWFSDSEMNNAVTFPVTVTKDTQYYAKWTINQYTITFNSNGGTGTAGPITDDYDSPVTLPVDGVTKTEHKFKGWSLEVDGTVLDSPYTLTKDITLYAVWEINEYTITFNANGGVGTVPETKGDYNTPVTLPVDGITKTGYEFLGWSTDAEATEAFTNHTFTENEILYAVWAINQYTITFDTVEGTVIEPITQDYGTTITAPENPAREGYTFDGWDPTIPATMPANDVLVTSTWKINKYTITFETGDGSTVESATVEYGDTVTKPTEPTREGYGFIGWFLADAEEAYAFETTPVTEPITLTAKWEADTYSIIIGEGITVKDAGGKVLSGTDTVAHDDILTVTANTKTGYHTPVITAKVGEKSVTVDDESYTVIGAVTFSVEWTAEIYTITFDTDGGTSIGNVEVKFDETIDLSPYVTERTGYKFVKWTLEDGADVPAKMPANDITVKATWTIESYSITFVDKDSTVVVKITQNYGTDVTEPAELTKEGYTLSLDQTIPATMPAADMTIVATWTINEYTITFVGDDEEEIVKITQNYGTDVTEPAELTKEGYTLSLDQTIPATMPAADMTIVATWTINEYTITFVGDDEEIVKITQNYGTEVTEPAELTKEGYTLSLDQTIPATMPAENMTIVATWTINEYTITFVGDDEEIVKITQNYGTEVTEPAELTKEGYTLSLDQTIPATMPAADMTIVATWTINEYTITWIVDGEEFKTEELEYGTTITKPTEPPTKGSTAEFDYVFSKWTGFTADMKVTKNETFTAKFTDEVRLYTIEFVDDITVMDGDTSINSGEEVAYGTELTVTAVDKTGYTSVVLANGDDVVGETHTVEGAVTFSVVRTFNLDKLGDFIENEDTPKIEISKDAAGELTNVEFEKLGNKTLVIDVVEDGKILYSWTLEGKYDSSKAGTFKASIVAEEPEGKLKDVIETSKVKNPLVLKFSAEGELPKNATVKYYVGDDFDEGTTLTLFFYNEEGNGLDRIASDLIVDENGYVEFSPPHFSQYVLAEMDSESGGAGSNTLLYVGVGIIVAIIAFIAVVALRRP